MGRPKLTKEQKKQSEKKKKEKAFVYNKEYTDKQRWSGVYHEKRRVYFLKRRYGLTEDITINRPCDICGKTEFENIHKSTSNVKRGEIDHDHVTGQIRGVLCHACNMLLRDADDNVETLKKAIHYLNTSRGVQSFVS